VRKRGNSNNGLVINQGGFEENKYKNNEGEVYSMTKVPVVIVADMIPMIFGTVLVLIALWIWFDAASTYNSAAHVLASAQAACTNYWGK
jgi:hypothetical protein